MEAEEVWRSLSSLTDEDRNSQSEQKYSKSEIQKKNKISITGFLKRYLTSFVLIAFVMSLVISILLFQQWTVQNQEIKTIKSKQELLEKQRQEIDKQIQELQRQRQEIDKQIENLELLIKEKRPFRFSLKPS